MKHYALSFTNSADDVRQLRELTGPDSIIISKIESKQAVLNLDEILEAADEILIDRGGKDDVYKLAEELGFELDDLFPIVEGAQLLGFLKVEEGDVAITESGRLFADSEILTQKELFRDAALEHILLLRQITRALDTKADRTVPEDFFLDLLDEQFSQEEAQHQLETAINWGRYAELFDFDAGRRRFIKPEVEEVDETPVEESVE